MNNPLAQALMQPTDEQLSELQRQQNGPMGGLFGSYGRYQPLRTFVQQSLQARTGAFNPAAIQAAPPNAQEQSFQGPAI